MTTPPTTGSSLWRIELLGRLRAARGDREITRFRHQKAAALLAYLAYYPKRRHPRDELIELLWPETDPEVSRGNLRFILHSLRRQLDPPDSPVASALPDLVLADRTTVSLNPAVFSTDVADFRAALQVAAEIDAPEKRVRLLQSAVALYRGELLPGSYEAWVFTERQPLAELYLGALQQLVASLEQAGDMEGALEYARQAVAADPLREEAHYDLMRLYAAAGQPSATLGQYRELERLLREELGETPSAATRALAEELRQNARTVIVTRASGFREPAVAEVDSATLAPPPPPAREEEKRGRGEGDQPVVPSSPPPLFPSSSGPAVPRLPVQFTRFFGREEEIVRLTETLSVPETRLVTLTGPGGSGKTRLAVAVAGRLQAEFEGAAWFVPLAELTEARRIGDALRDALGLPPGVDGAPLEQVAGLLARRPALLVLDNFEQLVEEGAALVRLLLERVPTLTCLVTSRQRLEIEGEQEFVVLPLPTPGQRVQGSGLRAQGSGLRAQGSEPGGPVFAPTLSPEPLSPEPPLTLVSYPSVALFIDRAQAARPGFALGVENAMAVAALCDRLEGLPLAIELAAARAAVLTPQQMLVRLEHRFELLVSARRDVSARHRSLRAAIEWSYHLLSPELQRFFIRLSIFRGGWTLESAETVCADDELPEPAYRWGGDLLQNAPPRVENPAALEYLEHLRQCSLVVVEEAPEAGMRFRHLESVREFAAEQLRPDELSALARRHLLYTMPIAHESRTRASPAKTAAAQRRRLREADGEYENLRAALEWGLQHEPAPALWLASALASYWSVRGLWAEALEFLPRAASFPSEPMTEMRSKALRYAGEMAIELGDYARAQAWLEESAALGRRMGEPEMIALARAYEGRSVPDPEVDRFRCMGASEYEAAALYSLGELAAAQGEYTTAHTLYQKSFDLRRELWDETLTASPLAGLGDVALAQGDYETAHACYERSLALFRAGGYRLSAGLRLRDLGIVAYRRSDYERARQYFTESLAIFEEYGERLGAGLACRGLGDVAAAQADRETAHRSYREGVTILKQLGHRQGVAGILEGFARLAQASGLGARAARLFGAAEALREALGSPLSPIERPLQQALLADLRRSLGETAFAAAWDAGRALPWERAVAEALGEE